jgi:hypothetical protein
MAVLLEANETKKENCLLGPNTKYNENKRAVENHPFGFS